MHMRKERNPTPPAKATAKPPKRRSWPVLDFVFFACGFRLIGGGFRGFRFLAGPIAMTIYNIKLSRHGGVTLDYFDVSNVCN